MGIGCGSAGAVASGVNVGDRPAGAGVVSGSGASADPVEVGISGVLISGVGTVATGVAVGGETAVGGGAGTGFAAAKLSLEGTWVAVPVTPEGPVESDGSLPQATSNRIAKNKAAQCSSLPLMWCKIEHASLSVTQYRYDVLI